MIFKNWLLNPQSHRPQPSISCPRSQLPLAGADRGHTLGPCQATFSVEGHSPNCLNAPGALLGIWGDGGEVVRFSRRRVGDIQWT